MKASELELVIGEAQQLYPEIWRHLDDARAALAGQDRDLVAFDMLRRDEAAQFGIIDIDVTGVKTATFNTAGYDRARDACELLVRAMPEVDWAEVVRIEAGKHAYLPPATALSGQPERRFLGHAKLIVIGAALLGLAIIVYRVVSSIEPEPAQSKKQEQKVAQESERWAVAERTAKITELRKIYESTCHRATGEALARVLREDSQVTEAKKIETTHCVPKRPSCDDAKDAIGSRLAANFSLVQDKAWSMRCEGITILRGDRFEPGLAVLISARDHEGRVQMLRGVASVDGGRDVVMFSHAPGAKLAAVGDLDGDGSDELVFVNTKELTVSKLDRPGFTDMPAMPVNCATDATIEADDRAGRKAETKLLVLSVPDGVKGKQCLKPGRHYFALTRDGLSETD
ncbi:MAG TPA: hypothetical protein VIV11_42230 [Kofleriaceae bacterium]